MAFEKRPEPPKPPATAPRPVTPNPTKPQETDLFGPILTWWRRYREHGRAPSTRRVASQLLGRLGPPRVPRAGRRPMPRGTARPPAPACALAFAAA